MTTSLNSYQAWLKHYEIEAATVPLHIQNNPQAFRSAMLEFSKTSLNKRAHQLRQSDSYLDKKILTTTAGLIPFLKIGVSVNLAEEFADEALIAFGLDNIPGLTNLANQFKAATSGRSEIPLRYLQAVAKESITDFFHHVASNTATEAVHLKPLVGQVWSAGTGYVTMRKRLLRIIDQARLAAEPIHQDLLVAVVIHNLRTRTFSAPTATTQLPPASNGPSASQVIVVPSRPTSTPASRRVSKITFLGVLGFTLVQIPLELLSSFTALVTVEMFLQAKSEMGTDTMLYALPAMVCAVAYAAKELRAFRVMLTLTLLSLAILWALGNAVEDADVRGMSFWSAAVTGIIYLRF